MDEDEQVKGTYPGYDAPLPKGKQVTRMNDNAPIKGTQVPPVEPAGQPSYVPGGYVAGPHGNGSQENLLQQLVRQCLADSNKYFPGKSQTLAHHTLALCGEVGELANLVKKIERGSLDGDTEGVRLALESEAADVLIYLLNVFGFIGADPLKAYIKKRNFNHGRFVK